MPTQLTFGPQPTRLKGTRVLSWILIALGAGLAAFLLSEDTGSLTLGGAAMAFAILAGGGFLLLRWAAKLERISARITPGSLDLTAPSGHRLGGNGPLLSASVPWSSIQAVRLVTIPTTEGVPEHSVCFLYSPQGDFTFHALHWERHDDLVAALLEHSGRSLDDPPPPRPGNQSLCSPGERITLSILRALGWAGLAGSALFLWFLVEALWKNGLNWSDAGMVPAFVAMLVGSYALTRIHTR